MAIIQNTTGTIAINGQQIRGVYIAVIDCSETSDTIKQAIGGMNRHIEACTFTISAECGNAIKESARCFGRTVDALREAVCSYMVNPLLENHIKNLPIPPEIQSDIYFGGVVGITYQCNEWTWAVKYIRNHKHSQARRAKTCNIIRKIIPMARRYDFNRGRHWNRKRR
jgi:hypothetical protein